jgi:EAL and modified HD-GYP domain-containing signal transduction protein
MFQGFYFNQPIEGRKTKEVSPLKVNYFRLMKLSSTDDYMDFKEISDIIASDVALSYKLLRILNSAAVGLKNVSSIAAAVAYMGEESLKKWIAVLALRGIAEDKPLELIRMSLIRARFGELLAPAFRIKRNEQQVFMLGMLSLLHIALEISKEKLLEDIPVADDISESLLTRHGVYSDLLRFYENYEYANWDAVSQFVDDNYLDSQTVNDAYITAVKWYNDLAGST